VFGSRESCDVSKAPKIACRSRSELSVGVPVALNASVPSRHLLQSRWPLETI
jgi:hypothetical protein